MTAARIQPWEILFAGYGDWILWQQDGFRTRSAQLARFLARSERVSCLHVLNETVYLRGIRTGFAVPRGDRFRALPLRSGPRDVEAKIRLLDPSRFLIGPDRLKRPLVLRSVRRFFPRSPASLPILWIANVHKAHLLGKVNAGLRVFDAIDDWEEVEAYRRLRRRIRRGYEQVFEHADLIYTVSSRLAERFRERARTPHVVHLPNGVDLELFREPALPPPARRTERGARPPVLTCVGVLSERTDFELIAQIARERPDCRVRLVGPRTAEAERQKKKLEGQPNLEWTGPVHHSRVPSLLREADVLLIPHRQSRLSLSMDPLKLYEYLTTGLPVVSTPVPPTENFADLIYVGEGPQFLSRLAEALGETDRPGAEDRWRARVEEARKHGWPDRVERITRDIERLLHPG